MDLHREDIPAKCRQPAPSAPGTDTRLLTMAVSVCYANFMVLSRARLLGGLARLPFLDYGELALILGEPLGTVHRALAGLPKPGLPHTTEPAPLPCLGGHHVPAISPGQWNVRPLLQEESP